MSDYLDVASDVENMCVEEGGVDIFIEDKDNVMHRRLRKCTGFWREIYIIKQTDHIRSC